MHPRPPRRSGAIDVIGPIDIGDSINGRRGFIDRASIHVGISIECTSIGVGISIDLPAWNDVRPSIEIGSSIDVRTSNDGDSIEIDGTIDVGVLVEPAARVRRCTRR